MSVLTSSSVMCSVGTARGVCHALLTVRSSSAFSSFLSQSGERALGKCGKNHTALLWQASPFLRASRGEIHFALEEREKERVLFLSPFYGCTCCAAALLLRAGTHLPLVFAPSSAQRLLPYTNESE